MKQTAVEWLVEQMRIRKEQGLTLSLYDLEMFAEQAKAMEKEQIERAFYLSKALEDRWENGEQYYNETFKEL